MAGKRHHAVLVAALAVLASLSCPPLVGSEPAAAHSCSTFVLETATTRLVGHNLDDYVAVPGLLIVNRRGLAKESISYADLGSFSGRAEDLPRKRWIAKHGSLTYSPFGREFPDGGMNEAGLYVGEMTLLGTVYPAGPELIKMYHHAWIQYLLDNFATVAEVLESLAEVTVDGHCQWHFLVSDRRGDAAVIEFLDGAVKVYTGVDFPIPVLTNFRYETNLEELAGFAGFGGSRELVPTDCEVDDLRFVVAASLLREAQGDAEGSAVDQAFAILRALDCGNNKWSLVFDPAALRVYWDTHLSRNRRWVDFSALDFACAAPGRAIDIHLPVAGAAAEHFELLDAARNRRYLEEFFSGLDVGLLGNLFWKGRMVKRLTAYQQSVTCDR